MKAKRIVFIVTESCQLRCKYCYIVGKNNLNRMSFTIAKQAIDAIIADKTIFYEPSLTFDFIGGEPLLEIELIEQITSYTIRKATEQSAIWKDNFNIRISTNGLLYNDSRVQKYIHKYKDILTISISIDGTKNKHDINRIFPNGNGSYDLVVANIRRWIEQFPNASTRMVISHEDVAFVKDSLVHLINLGINKIDTNTVVENVWELGDDIILEQQLVDFADYIFEKKLYNKVNISAFEYDLGEKMDCNYPSDLCGDMFYAIDCKGNYYPCMRFAQYSLRAKSPRVVGNISTGIDWNKLRPFRNIPFNVFANKECLNCNVSGGCRMCAAENYDASSNGTIFEKSIVACKMHKAKVRAKNYYWNKLYNIKK